jgi:predicted MFS family arabinose efflux permease
VFFAAAIGSILGPNLLGPSGEVAGAIGLPRLAGLYLVAIVCFATAASLLAIASSPRVTYFGDSVPLVAAGKRSRVDKGSLASDLKAPAARTGLLILAATNMVMGAVMAIAPVHLAAHGYNLGLVGTVVGIHVGGMFVPSPVSGRIADRLGPAPVAGAGFFLLAAAGIAGTFLDISSAVWMTVMLILLGVGWNFGVVGGSTMLAASIPAPLRPHAEGLGEVAMGLAAGAGAPIAGVVVALGGFTALSLVGVAVAAVAAIALALIRWAA